MEHKNNNNHINWFDTLNYFLLFGLIIVTLFPFVHIISVSLSDAYSVLQNKVFLWPKGLNFDTYKVVLSDQRVLYGYRNTITYTVLGTLISLVLTAMGAFALSRREFMLRRTFTMMVVFTMLFGGGMIPTFLTVRALGIMDTILAIVLPAAISVWNLLIMRTFFQALPEEIFDSARVDGLSDLGIFWRIVIPLSKPVLATIGLFYAVSMWNNFMLAFLYIRDADLYPLQVMLRNVVLAGQLQVPGGSTSSADDMVPPKTLRYTVIVAATLPILFVYPFIQKYFVKGAMIGSVKG